MDLPDQQKIMASPFNAQGQKQVIYNYLLQYLWTPLLELLLI